jgi:restriction system protein
MAKISTTSILKAIAREAARSQRQAEANHRRLLREQVAQRKAEERQIRQAEINRKRSQAQSERERKQLEKEEQQQYITSRMEETTEYNAEIVQRVTDLSQVLEHTLSKNDTIAFDSLRVKEQFPPFVPPQELIVVVPPPDKQPFLKQVKPMTVLENALGMKGRYQRELQAAEAQYATIYKSYEASEAEKKTKLEQLNAEYETNRQAFLQKVQQRDQEVTELEAAYIAGEGSAVITYTTMVLERSEYPDGFPQNFRLAYMSESKEVVIDYDLPWLDVVPTITDYKYNRTKDTIDEKHRKPAEINALYQDIITAVTLRSIHEVFEADQGNHVQVVTFSGFVTIVDPATGKDIRPCLVSVRTTRDAFMDINLSKVNKQVCLRNLGARVSSRPEERLPVKPVVEFDMVDKRFVDQADVLSGLDARPNLMELSPTEFEGLVSNLFGKMGLETKLTRSSKDGGVDVVAFDTRPILGGKVVIQAKRYRHTVGVSAVRDLYGTMVNEGASKGIIVTTSSYGPDSYEFAKDKPLELIDGGGLLYLLDQVGVKAKIIMPQE